jgi:tetratricopeptide (TPR) repeat protein
VLGAFRERGERIEPALADTLADLGRLDSVTRISLGNLSPEEMGEFVRVAAAAEPTPDLLFAIAELTDGTPLLVCELWRDLRQLDAVEVSEAGVRLTRPLSELQGTERVRDAVGARLQRLSPATAAIIELAAVAGPRFEPRVLAEASALGQPALVAALAEAVGSGVVEDLPAPAPACRFTHELVRRAVYDRITGIRRAQLHLTVGEALERVHAADLAPVLPELAHHFTLGVAVGGPERAVEYNLRAADAAIGAAAFNEAAERVATALELGIADPQERERVQLELVYLLRDSGRFREASNVLAATVESASGPARRRIAAYALMQRGETMGNPVCDPVRMQAGVRRALATFADLGDPRGLAIAGRRLGMALRRGGRMTESRAVLEEALEHANDAGGWTARRQVIGTLTYVLCDGPTPVAEAIRRCEELRDSGPRDLELDAVVNRSLAALLAMAGRLDEARELGASSSRLLDPNTFNVHSSVYRIIAAEQKELCGDRAGAEDDLIAKWEQFGRRPSTDARAMHAAYHLALLYCDDGRWDEAEHWLEYGEEIPVPEHFLHEAVLGLAARARVVAHRGRVDEGLALARRGVSLAEQGEMPNLTARTWLALAEVERRSGRASEADAAVAPALRLYEEKGNVTAAAALRPGGHLAAAKA